MKYLNPYFVEGSYDIISKNCNSFTDAALYFLTKTRLGAQFSRLERMLRSVRPVSVKMTKMLIQFLCHEDPSEAGEKPMLFTPWVDNPRAANFSVEEVVVCFDAFDVESSQQTNSTPQKTNLWSCPALCGAENSVLNDIHELDFDRDLLWEESPVGGK